MIDNIFWNYLIFWGPGKGSVFSIFKMGRFFVASKRNEKTSNLIRRSFRELEFLVFN